MPSTPVFKGADVMTPTEHTAMPAANAPLLQVENLSIQLPGPQGPVPLVDGLSFNLATGQTLGLVGASGSGKSLTGQSILRLLPERPWPYGPQSRITLAGQPVLQLAPAELRRLRGATAGLVFQEPMTALNPLHSIERQLGEAIALHQGLRGEALRHKVIAQLDRVGIAQAAQRLGAYPHQLSGGQRQRVMIAMALANNPQLLIADEPTTALDVTTAAHIMALLDELRLERGLALLLISHDLRLIERHCDAVAVLHQGRLVEAGTVAAVYAAPQSSHTQALLDAKPQGQPVAAQPDAPEVLAVRNLRVAVPRARDFWGRGRDWRELLAPLRFTLQAGQTLAVVGESGSGKTTLALALMRLMASQGDILLQQMPLHNLAGAALRAVRPRMQMVFQDPFSSLSPRMTLGDILGEGLRVHQQLAPEALAAAVAQTLTDVGLDPAMHNRYPHELSGGQRQRVAIGRALILRPQVLILDEPTSALDRAVQVQILDLLRQLQAQFQLSYLFISHDMAMVQAIAHQVLVLKDGQVVEAGSAQQVLNHPQAAYTQALLAAARA
jgi:microcin C transport system ATP-binding protein